MTSYSQWPLPAQLPLGPFHLVGNSLAGQSTSFLIPELSIAFDVGYGLPYLQKAHHFFITHAHMDHAGGLPYLISQKALQDQKAPKFYVPELHAEGLGRIMKEWSVMEGHIYDFEIIPMKPGQTIELTHEWSVKAFQTVHRVTSLGYTLFQTKKKLKPEFQGLETNQFRALKQQGVSFEQLHSEPWFSFTGDTQIEFLDQTTDWVKHSRYLMMEVTYIDASRTIERAKEWGHIHLEELWPRLKDLTCEKVYLIHLSARHRSAELTQIIAEKAPEDWKDRLIVWPRDGLAL